jgi:hypothetical protein
LKQTRPAAASAAVSMTSTVVIRYTLFVGLLCGSAVVVVATKHPTLLITLMLLNAALLLLQWVIRHTLFGGLLSDSTLVAATKNPHCMFFINSPCCCCCICPVIYVHAVGNPPHVVWRAAVWFHCGGGDEAPYGHPGRSAGGGAGSWQGGVLWVTTGLCTLESTAGGS